MTLARTLVFEPANHGRKADKAGGDRDLAPLTSDTS